MSASLCYAGHDHNHLRTDDEAWSQLAYVGMQADDFEVLELRNCACHSTLCRVVAKEAA